MPTLVKRIDLLAALLFIIAAESGALYAQQPSVAPLPADSPSSAASTPPTATGTPATAPSTDNGTSSALDYLFNHKPQEGTAGKEVMGANDEAKNRALAQDALGTQQIDDPDTRARFERYLSMTEVSQDQIQNYATDMQTVIDLLHQRRTTEAWQKLYKLAQYKAIDSGVSWELANRIETIWNADQTKNQIAQQNTQLQQQSDTDNRNADMDSDDIKDKEIEYQRKLQNAAKGSGGQNGGNPSQVTVNQGNQGNGNDAASNMNPPSDQILGKLQLTAEYLSSLEAQSKIKLNELKVDKLFDQAKSDFADYITTLFKSGRYQHVLIAADFWRQIFNEGDYPVSMAQQVNASLEINGEIDTTIGVFNNNMNQKQVAAATQNLQQAFSLSELNPTLLGVPLERKKPVLAFVHELARMQNIIEARDFSDLQPILDEIKLTAPDFDSVKAMSIVNGVELQSQLSLGKAKLAAQQGDLKTAMEDFQEAAEAWPGNPDLKNKAAGFFNSEDDKTQSLDEFDRLVTENNYRAIFDKQLAFAPAMKDDDKRQAQLKTALDKVRIAETAIEKATLMESNGDVDGAWETVQAAVKDLPDDNKLNSLRADLSAKGADFVAAITKAQDAEAKQELGMSLSWYAVAQRTYPASELANAAIDRLSKAILAKSTL
jgi:tetratricopeptide (TPR) repeat protein